MSLINRGSNDSLCSYTISSRFRYSGMCHNHHYCHKNPFEIYSRPLVFWSVLVAGSQKMLLRQQKDVYSMFSFLSLLHCRLASLIDKGSQRQKLLIATRCNGQNALAASFSIFWLPGLVACDQKTRGLIYSTTTFHRMNFFCVMKCAAKIRSRKWTGHR